MSSISPTNDEAEQTAVGTVEDGTNAATMATSPEMGAGSKDIYHYLSKDDTVRFDPTSIGLPAGWSLTDWSDLKGCACKIPQGELQEMLSSLQLSDGKNVGTADGRIALDCSVRKTRHSRPPSKGDGSRPSYYYSISTTDFFFPLVDSPYVQGRIGAANVLSDLYAEGVEHCDFVLMLLAACRNMPPNERTICTQQMVRGFRDACREADTAVTGGQTVLNPWPIIGGVATSIVTEEEFVASDGAQVGDIVVLTKPLGTQVAVNVHQWRNRLDSPSWKKCLEQDITIEQAEDMMHAAVCSMARLNRNGGRLMLKYKAHACTDVTGFGILGHAQNLSENQRAEVGIELHTLPLIAGTKLVNDKVFNFRLTIGYSAETSGGLMVCLPPDQVEGYRQELEALDGTPTWIIGKVVHDVQRKSKIVDDCQWLEV